MRFISLYKTPERNTPPTPEEMANMGKLIEEWMKSGKLLGTEGCLPSAHGARVRIDNGKFTVSDGPFTEAKEVVGGFAILNAPSKEVAIQYAKEFLEFTGQGECELRQLYDMDSVPAPCDQHQEAAAR
jgi:hypothetical protein